MTKARYTPPAYPALSSLLHSKNMVQGKVGNPSGFPRRRARARGRWETMEDAKRMEGLSTGSASANECEELPHRNEGFPFGKAVVQAVHALAVWAGKLFIRGWILERGVPQACTWCGGLAPAPRYRRRYRARQSRVPSLPGDEPNSVGNRVCIVNRPHLFRLPNTPFYLAIRVFFCYSGYMNQ